ncbi:glycoside hydrolase family 18 protein [Tilletiaria anomala UBC 951]|uniref:Glycoside hydrolase family 18 protein n=1 Tax=Tilletiaria anomala (strain ATCC 24038 / CBS 436.72 / UBC 951) TaxID=1037660 RepID=A0A066V5U9_TILAU|nr:glycoside hydrolase family 18 protein [Tilletiaria anomala UBC 951]KDN37122.1 glycoside hydrolase family 18 protein [Tilletiaria anomala UBC 951]
MVLPSILTVPTILLSAAGLTLWVTWSSPDAPFSAPKFHESSHHYSDVAERSLRLQRPQMRMYEAEDVMPQPALPKGRSRRCVPKPGLAETDFWKDRAGMNNLYGSLKCFGLMKLLNRSFKLPLLEDHGFGGADIDGEFSADAKRTTAMTNLLKVLVALNAAQAKRTTTTKPKFLLTVAVSASRTHISTMNLAGMDHTVEHQANLYNATNTSPASEAKGSGSGEMQARMKAGIAAHKLVLGLLLYGCSFGVGAGGDGYWELKALPLSASQHHRGHLGKLDATKNYISYPFKFDNARNGFN